MNLNTVKLMKLPSVRAYQRAEILRKLEDDRKNRNISPASRNMPDSSNSSELIQNPVLNHAEIEAVVGAATDRNDRNRSFCLHFLSIFCPCFRTY